MANAVDRVIVIGLDGLDPGIVEPMLEAGSLPALARLRSTGGYSRLATTNPAQTPVAWSTFATGVNPGRHGIFDFIRRDPTTYTPDLSFNRYEQKSSFLPPKVINLRRGPTVWDVLSKAGLPSTIIRCPCSYPPETMRGQILAGMGVPDLRGSLGMATFYTSGKETRPGTGESVVPLAPSPDGSFATQLLGPRNPKTREHYILDITLHPQPTGSVLVHSNGQPAALEVPVGRWSDWLKVKFKVGLLQSVKGMVRFWLVRSGPALELYASPVNFDPAAPLFPISSPAGYAAELAGRIGTFYTTGMVEDHDGMNNGRLDEVAFLKQCEIAFQERERMMLSELNRSREGLFFCLFDTPDRVQHMFWRFREPKHPANRGEPPSPRWAKVIDDYYKACDAVVARALESADDRTLVVALSDHGFNSFQRGVGLNTWLHQQGLLALKPGVEPGEAAGDFLHAVDWSRTQAYSLGLSGIYLNRAGREAKGIVSDEDAPALQVKLAEQLTGLTDPERGQVAIRRALTRESVYSGPCTTDAPDVLVNCDAGYRISWGTALGGVGRDLFEDNTKPWSGDHIIDPELVPGVFFSNRPFRSGNPQMTDLAPTILAALGVPKSDGMEGASLLQ